jgi:hypothetical protein
LVLYFSWYSEEYDWFYIDSEAQFYALHVSMLATGDAGDSLSTPWDLTQSATAMKFSSKDADHDKSSSNCALLSGGGWWYNDCSHSAQLGDPNVSNGIGYQWRGLAYTGVETATNSVIMASRMMIKAIN